MSLNDFNFLFGKWIIHNRVLCTRLRNVSDWRNFVATFECRSLGRLGNIGHFKGICEGENVEGATLRLYNPETDEWTIRLADVGRPGAIQPPVTGHFERGAAVFYGNAFYDSRPIRVRAIWTRGQHPRFEQAFSTDRGVTWETNWYMRLTPVAASRESTAEARVPDAQVLGAGSRGPFLALP
jgi:hypothetical protein